MRLSDLAKENCQLSKIKSPNMCLYSQTNAQVIAMDCLRQFGWAHKVPQRAGKAENTSTSIRKREI